MKISSLLPIAVILVNCSENVREPDSSGELPSKASSEPPFYNVYPNGTGALTMEELQINLPSKLDRLYTDEMRACLLAKIEELAADAGDPETLDPSSVAFLPTDGSWEKLPRFAKRSLLAQVVVSRAATLC